MLWACINIQVVEELVTKAVLREHTLYCSLDQCCWSLCEDITWCGESLSTWISCVTDINSVCHLLALEGDLLGVNYDNVVTAVYVRSVTRLCLTAKDKSNSGSKTTEWNVCRIDNDPAFFYSCLIEADCLVAKCVHCLDF